MKKKLYLGIPELINSQIFEDISASEADLKFVIVPDQFKLSMESHLAEKNGGGLMTIEVLSFSRLASRLVINQKLTPISQIGRNLLIMDLMRDLRSQLIFFGKNHSKYSFATRLGHLFSQMTEPIPRPERPNRLDAKISDINLIFEHYNRRIEGKYIDDERFIKLASGYCESTELLRDTDIFILHYNHMTENELALLGSISKNAKNTTIAIHHQNHPAFHYTQRLIDSLPSEFLDCQTHFYGEQCLSGARPSNPAQIADYLFAPRPKLIDPIKLVDPSPVRILCADSVHDEVCLVASEIVKLLLEGVSPTQIAVICPELDGYRLKIASTFPLYNLPFFIEEKMTLRNNPLREFLLAFMDFVINPTNIDPVLKLLKSGIFPAPDYQIKSFEIFCIENGVRFDTFRASDYSLYHGIINIFKDIKERFRARQYSVSDFFKKLYSLMQKDYELGGSDYSIYRRLKNHSNKKDGDQINSRIINEIYNDNEMGLKIWNAFTDVVDQIYALAEEGTKSLTDLREIIENATANLSFGNVPTGHDHIAVGRPNRARTHEREYQFVMGALDGSFPKVYSDHSIFTSMERDSLEVVRSFNNLRDLEEEKFDLYVTISSPKKQIIFSYPRDGDNSPSLILSSIEELFGLRAEMVHSPNISLARPDIALQNFAKIKEFNLEKWFQKNRKSEYQDLVRFKDFDVNLKKTRIKFAHIIEDSIRTSVTAVNKYANSPFVYFLESVLRLKEIRPYKVDHLFVGNLIHYGLEKYVLNQYLKGEPLSMEEYLKQAKLPTYLKKAEEIFIQIKEEEGNLFATVPNNKAIMKKLKKSLALAAMTVDYHILTGRFRPADCELEFNDFKLGKFIFKGKIDRYDIAEFEPNQKLFRIIDYKTGGKDFKMSSITGGSDIQLYVYSKYIEEYEGADLAGFYLFNTASNNYISESSDLELYHRNPLDGATAFSETVISASSGNSSSNTVLKSVSMNKVGKINMRSKNRFFTNDEESIDNRIITKKDIEKAVGDILEAVYNSMEEGRIDADSLVEPCQGKSYYNKYDCIYMGKV